MNPELNPFTGALGSAMGTQIKQCLCHLQTQWQRAIKAVKIESLTEAHDEMGGHKITVLTTWFEGFKYGNVMFIIYIIMKTNTLTQPHFKGFIPPNFLETLVSNIIYEPTLVSYGILEKIVTNETRCIRMHI